MQKESIKNVTSSCDNEKIELPKDVQKRLMEFFLKTSIPRKKAMSINTLPEKEKAGK